jgi:hypothetical protein
MSLPTVRNFMKQQGFAEEPDSVRETHFSALSFQPKVMGVFVVLAILLQSPLIFFALSAILWWSVLLPRWNPFELLYSRLMAVPRERPALGPAPAPRRFSQGMAATFTLMAGLALISGWTITAWIFEAFLVIAIAALLFGKFCLGAYIYHLLRGKISFANDTLPWARPRT